MQRNRIAILLLLLVISACGGSAGTGQARPNRTVLTTDEIRASHYTDAFSLVQALRPDWLSTRGQGSLTLREEVKVYLDGMKMGGPEYLKQITTESISLLRYINGLDATQRWGLDHGNGVIEVSTRRGGTD